MNMRARCGFSHDARFLLLLYQQAPPAAAQKQKESKMSVNVISYGGGVQSTALLVLAARGVIRADAAIFVEIDLENPATTRYVREVAEPFCRDAGIEFIRVNVSLTRMILDNPAFPPVPFRDGAGKLFGWRQCTNHAKIRPFRRALRALMRARGARRANVMLGISADEIERMRDSDVRYITHVYPLVDLNLSRSACKHIIDGELTIPQKSSCWFCPFAPGAFQRRILRENPHLMRQAAHLQDVIDKARSRAGLDRLMVLRCDTSQQDMFEEPCGGTCHT